MTRARVRIPARKSAPSDCSAMNAKMTIAIEGGTTGPIVADAAVIAALTVARVTRIGHRLHFDSAEPARVGDGRARHAREYHRSDDVHVSEPARDVPHEDAREGEDALGDAEGVHETPGEDEQRNREERERVDTARRASGRCSEAAARSSRSDTADDRIMA